LDFFPLLIAIAFKIFDLCFLLNNKNFEKLKSLKVVGNEKSGGSGGWLLFEDGFGPWRSMSVCF
jgi:hypothetical protein